MTLEVQFAQDGVAVELPDNATGVFGVKRVGKYDDDYVVAALAWVKTGSGASALYTFTLSFINAELDALFFVDGVVTNDVATLSLMGELQWIVDGNRFKSQTIQVVVDNDVNRAGDEVPAAPALAYGVFIPSITGLVGGGTANLDGFPTIFLLNDYVVQVLVESGGEWQWLTFVLKSGPATEPNHVAPVDYDAMTNDRHWAGALGPPSASVTEPMQDDFVASDGQVAYGTTADMALVSGVAINGLLQPRSEYTAVGNVVTFNDGSGIVAGDVVSIFYLGL